MVQIGFSVVVGVLLSTPFVFSLGNEPIPRLVLVSEPSKPISALKQKEKSDLDVLAELLMKEEPIKDAVKSIAEASEPIVDLVKQAVGKELELDSIAKNVLNEAEKNEEIKSAIDSIGTELEKLIKERGLSMAQIESLKKEIEKIKQEERKKEEKIKEDEAKRIERVERVGQMVSLFEMIEEKKQDIDEFKKILIDLMFAETQLSDSEIKELMFVALEAWNQGKWNPSEMEEVTRPILREFFASVKAVLEEEEEKEKLIQKELESIKKEAGKEKAKKEIKKKEASDKKPLKEKQKKEKTQPFNLDDFYRRRKEGTRVIVAPEPQQVTPQLDGFEAECLAVHNQHRIAEGLAPFEWNPTLAAHAQAWSNYLVTVPLKNGQIDLIHENQQVQGDNLYGLASNSAPSCKHAVDSWMAEREIYDALGRPPIGSMTPEQFHAVGHYTQIAWKSTRQVGCATAQVNNKIIITCRYDPIGNRPGQVPY